MDLFRTTPTTAAPAGATTMVNINVADVNVPLQLGVDESYTLAWPADGSAATITAKTIYGAMMALQTLSQAVRYDFDAGNYAVQGCPLAITDAPKFAWRGILIDTDRHWLSLHTIQRIIDALGMAKMNIREPPRACAPACVAGCWLCALCNRPLPAEAAAPRGRRNPLAPFSPAPWRPPLTQTLAPPRNSPHARRVASPATRQSTGTLWTGRAGRSRARPTPSSGPTAGRRASATRSATWRPSRSTPRRAACALCPSSTRPAVGIFIRRADAADADADADADATRRGVRLTPAPAPTTRPLPPPSNRREQHVQGRECSWRSGGRFARGMRLTPTPAASAAPSPLPSPQYPELCCSAACGPQSNYPLSPVPDANGKNVSLDAIQAVLSEIAAVTTDEFFHLGGDEVDQSCWANTPAVQNWMKSVGIATTDEVYEYFVSKVDEMTINLNRSPIRWEEVWKHFGTDLDQRTVIHAWLSSEALINCTSLGYRAIWSVDGLYYLDALGETWDKFYDVDILQGVTNASAIPLILGGETEMWGETADGSDVLQTIFPRAAASAERQWSYDVVTNSQDPLVLPRMQQFRCHMLERGVPSAPIGNANARTAPGGPDSCLS
jgi:hypothetical protein